MTSAHRAETRTLTVVLNESDWRAFRAVEPDAIGWLHERIQERLGTQASQQPAPKAPITYGEFED